MQAWDLPPSTPQPEPRTPDGRDVTGDRIESSGLSVQQEGLPLYCELCSCPTLADCWRKK